MQTRVDEFLHYVVTEKSYSQHTVAAYRNDLVQLVAYLANETISSWQDVNQDQILDYVQYLKEHRYALSTVVRKLATVKSFFHFLAADGVLENDPTIAVDFPTVDKSLPHPLSPKEMARLLSEPAKSNTPKGLRDQALLELMYATGMRVSEIIGLETDAVDLESGTVRCLGTRKKERILPLHERVREVLGVYLEHGRTKLMRGRNETALFINRLGRPLTRQGLWLIVKEYAADAGLAHKVTPHTFRHSFATHLLNNGAGLRKIQQLMGHTNIASTQIYTQVSSERKQDTYDKTQPKT